ncbi:hypothetical protein ACHAWF_008852 [Thalassiosira exigua]
MNLALLNPFRQADRIDSTLSIPRALHPPRPRDDQSKDGGDKPTTKKGKRGAQAVKKKPKDTGGSPSKLSESISDHSQALWDGGSSKGPTGIANAGGASAMEADAIQSKGDGIADLVASDSKGLQGAESHDADGEDYGMLGDSLGRKKRRRTGSDDEDEENVAAMDVSASGDDDSPDDNYWTACYAVSFDRRGSFLASGHASGLVPVHDFLGRTLCALYRPPPGIRLGGMSNACAPLGGFDYGRAEEGEAGKGVGKEAKGRRKGKPGRPKAKDKGKGGGGKKGGKGGETAGLGGGMVKITSSDDLLASAAASAIWGGGPGSSSGAAAPSSGASGGTLGSVGTPCGASARRVAEQVMYENGVTHLSWDRGSHTLLAGAIGDRNLRLMDNSHPLVATDCTDAVRRQFLAESGGKDVIGENETPTSLEEKKDSVIAMSPPLLATLPPMPSPGGKDDTDHEKIVIRMETVSLGRARLLRSNVQYSGKGRLSPKSFAQGSLPEPMALGATLPELSQSAIVVPARRHPTLVLELPQPLGGPAEIHPRDSQSGLACMIDGSLAIFWLPPMAFYEALYTWIVVDGERRQWVANLLTEQELGRAGNLMYLVPPPSEKSRSSISQSDYFVTSATFCKNEDDVVWAVTKCGCLLGFCISRLAMNILHGKFDRTPSATAASLDKMAWPAISVKVPGGAPAWQIVTSKNGKYTLVNSADCALRLYAVEELCQCFNSPSSKSANSMRMVDVKPRFVFQDNISKAPWASCDFSGDCEYVVGGCNSYPQPGDNYKLFLWNCVTGDLVDQLTGPVSSLYSLSCHPTRPFIAVGTSDGLIDIWGARLDWVAFAPDFQALQQNEVYEEREDEFDTVVDFEVNEGSNEKGEELAENHSSPEDQDVDITSTEKIPAFDSDSEDESDVFYFHTKVDKILSEKQPGPKKTELE